MNNFTQGYQPTPVAYSAAPAAGQPTPASYVKPFEYGQPNFPQPAPVQPAPVQPAYASANMAPQPYQVAPSETYQPPADLLNYTPEDVLRQRYGDDHPALDPTHYSRDPSVLIGYLVPFPQPVLDVAGLKNPPPRFLIYTPPPPPLWKPLPMEKEGKGHKVQRKWEGEVKEAKQSKGVSGLGAWTSAKSKAVRGINTAMNATKSSGIEFMTRVGGYGQEETGGMQVPLREIVLVHPPIPGMTENQLRAEFIDDVLRTKRKATRDSIIATSLLPVAEAIDILSTVVWPFGGALEVDAVWAISSWRGAKAARSLTRRLTGSGDLKLTFRAAERMEVLSTFMNSVCHERNPARFPSDYRRVVMDYQVVEAIGWSPSTTGMFRNWEDDQWELSEVRDDLRQVFKKSAREYDRWVNSYQKNQKKVAKATGVPVAMGPAGIINSHPTAMASPARYESPSAMRPAGYSSPAMYAPTTDTYYVPSNAQMAPNAPTPNAYYAPNAQMAPNATVDGAFPGSRMV